MEIGKTARHNESGFTGKIIAMGCTSIGRGVWVDNPGVDPKDPRNMLRPGEVSIRDSGPVDGGVVVERRDGARMGGLERDWTLV